MSIRPSAEPPNTTCTTPASRRPPTSDDGAATATSARPSPLTSPTCASVEPGTSNRPGRAAGSPRRLPSAAERGTTATPDADALEAIAPVANTTAAASNPSRTGSSYPLSKGLGGGRLRGRGRRGADRRAELAETGSGVRIESVGEHE